MKPPVHPTDIYRDLGRRIVTRRAALRLSQAQLAERVGLSRASIANIEAGRQNLPLHKIYDLLAALELDDLTALMPIPRLVANHDVAATPLSINGETELTDRARAQIEAIYASSAV